jgi:hypothetical protein
MFHSDVAPGKSANRKVGYWALGQDQLSCGKMTGSGRGPLGLDQKREPRNLGSLGAYLPSQNVRVAVLADVPLAFT